MKIFTYVMLIGIGIISINLVKAQTTILSNEDFSSGVVPTGWSSTKNSQAVGWQFGTYTQAVETELYQGNTYTLFEPTANGEMAFDLDYNNNDTMGYATEDRLITPSYDLSSYSIVNLSFQAYFLQYFYPGQDTEKLTCEASADGGSTWTVLESVQANPYWQTISVNANAFAGKSNVEFCFHYNDGGMELIGAAFTNVSITGWATSFIPQHNVVFEEGTGMWCGYCVEGIVYQDSVEKVYPNTAITIAVHDNDALSEFNNSTEDYDYYESTFPGFPGYPTDAIDRNSLTTPILVFSQYNNHLNDFCDADITVTPSYDANSRNATIDVSGHFAVALNGSYNYALVLTEDSVMGNSSSYDQNNYFNSQFSNYDYYTTMGDFNNLPDPVPYTDMYYMYVARDILDSYNGTSGSLPSTIAANSTQAYTFNYTVPGSCNAARMKAIALLIDNSTGDILNANYAYLIPRKATAISELNSGVMDAAAFPNPFSNNVNLSISLTKSEHVVLILNDILGRTIKINDEGNLAPGGHDFVYNASSLASGIYLMTIKTDDGEITRKIVKQ